MHKVFRYPKLSEFLKQCPRNFSALCDQNYSTENCDTPYYAQNFSMPQVFWVIEGMLTNFFGTVRLKLFETRNFLKNSRIHLRNFSALWDQKFSTENVIPPIMHKFFRYPNFSETLKGCPRNFLAVWDQKFWTEKRDTPLFMHKTFRNQNISQKQ